MDGSRLLERIVEGSSDAIVFCDREGVIRFWSHGAQETFGWSAAEAVGRSLDIIIPERLRARHWEGWDGAMKRGSSRYGKETLAVPAARKDGSSISIEFTIQLVRDDSGAILGPAAVIRDVTARFQRDKELRLRVKELEKRLAEAGLGV